MINATFAQLRVKWIGHIKNRYSILSSLDYLEAQPHFNFVHAQVGIRCMTQDKMFIGLV